MSKFFKSVLKTAAYLLEQSDRVAADVRDCAAEGVDRASDRVSDLRDRTRNLYGTRVTCSRERLVLPPVSLSESVPACYLPPLAEGKPAIR